MLGVMHRHEFYCLLVHLLKFSGPENLPRSTAQVFAPLMRYLLCSLVSSSFLDLLRYLKKSFLSSPIVWWSPLSIFPSICKFPFLGAFWFCLDLVVLVLPSFVFFCFLLAWHIFLCQIPPLYPHCISSLPRLLLLLLSLLLLLLLFDSRSIIATMLNEYLWNSTFLNDNVTNVKDYNKFMAKLCLCVTICNHHHPIPHPTGILDWPVAKDSEFWRNKCVYQSFSRL